MVIPFHVMNYITSESVRQSATSDPMVAAYAKAINYSGPLTELFILSLANCFGFDGYRTTPVIFESGSLGTNSTTIPAAMQRMVQYAPGIDAFSE